MIMSDRICLMNEGRIEQIGSPPDLYFRPATIFAADFLGESNMLDATVVATEGGTAILAGVTDAPLRAPAPPGLRPGDRVKLVVRPERLAVLRPGEEAENVLDGVLREAILVGGVTKHYVSLADGRTLAATRLTSGPAGAVGPDARVRVGWAVESGVVLPV